MKEISSKELRDQFCEVINDVSYKNEKYTVTRNGKEMAVILSLEEYEKFIETMKQMK